MDYSPNDLEQLEQLEELAAILEGEAEACLVDRALAGDLVEKLTVSCPHIAGTLSRIGERMANGPRSQAA